MNVRHLIVATLIAIAAQPVLVMEPVSAQEYPVVEGKPAGFENLRINLMEHFINGGAPVGNTDLEKNCRPSGEVREALFKGGDDFRRSFGADPTGRGRSIYPLIYFSESAEAEIVNRYFQCIGLERFSEPKVFGCSSIKTLFRYLEMFQPNHPSPDRARWSEMDQELYVALYMKGSGIIWRDEDGSMRNMYGNRWILCKEFWE